MEEPFWCATGLIRANTFVLMLGDMRWLSGSGRVLTLAQEVQDQIREYRQRGYEVGIPVPEGNPVSLTAENREYWEAAARRGGHELADLLAPDSDL